MKKFHLFKLGRIDSISHLLFVDDVIIFRQANHSTIKADEDVLHQFTRYTGMQINHSKSSVVYSKSCSMELREILENLIQISAKDFPIRYLRPPLTTGNLKHSDYGGLIASLEKHLSCRQGRKLSYVGQMQLFNWVFAGKVMFQTQATRLPKKTLHKIKSIGYRFMWGGHKGASWEKITQLKEDGGLGVRDFAVTEVTKLQEGSSPFSIH